MVLAVSDQAIHCQVKSLQDDSMFFVSFVYAANKYIQRRPLWRELNMHSSFIGTKPWVMKGDFNTSLSVEESSIGSSSGTISMREFKECVGAIRMSDVNHSGFRFTWNQKPNSSSGILKKLDRVMVNDVFIDKFFDSYVLFQPYKILDHCPAVLKIPIGVELRGNHSDLATI
ncbi:uncharacterized protein [Rutidosis leptorrhynchoides]|uniref:uncharacterized protein n=1 Tax=Rutidosis leptorrhynchoides TaxID=125765 RepID=UPI003A98E6B4